MLQNILTYHVVPGRIDSKSLIKMIKKNGGSYSAKTVQGGTLTFTRKGNKIMIQDEKGGRSNVTIADVKNVAEKFAMHAEAVFYLYR